MSSRDGFGTVRAISSVFPCLYQGRLLDSQAFVSRRSPLICLEEDMMRRILPFVVVTLLSFTTSALAQVQSGSILVKAVDQSGSVVPGATITISSSILPQE